jgi:hypothetical protein
MTYSIRKINPNRGFPLSIKLYVKYSGLFARIIGFADYYHGQVKTIIEGET